MTSVEDLLRYGRFHLGDGTVPGGAPLLSPESLRRMHETQVVQHGTDEEMALGWRVATVGTLRALWHDGATVGQQSLLWLIPSRQLALAVLTNSVRGEAFNREVRRAVAREYLGVTESDPSPIRTRHDELAQYPGRYSRPFMDVVVTADDEGLLIQRIQKQGFPSSTNLVPPARPPVPYRFYARDRLIGRGAMEGDRVEFLRGPDGAIGWIRGAGRLAPRLATAR